MKRKEMRTEVKWGLSNTGIQWEYKAVWDEDNMTDQEMN